MIPVVIAWVGGSVAIGTAPPFTGSTLPISAVDYRQGILRVTLDPINSGPQDGFLDCMDAQGYAVTLFERGLQGITVNYLQTVHVPNVINDINSHGLVADAIVVIHGGNDSKSITYASSYAARMFGPWLITGPGSTDTSVAGLIRTAYGQSFPLVITTVTSHNGENLFAGLPENDDYYWHRRVRAQQLYGCDQDSFCHPVLTGETELELAADLHPTSQSYYDLGWMICQRIIMDVL